MKLSSEELQIIETVLIQKGIKFDDIRIELLDHIASDVEMIRNSKAVFFEEAFEKVLQKWSESLKPSSSFLTGPSEKYPKIVIDSIYETVKNQFLISIVSAIFVVLLFIFFKEIVDSRDLMIQFKFGMKIVFVLSLLWIVYFRFFIYNKKFSTIFSHFAKTRMVVFFFYIPSIFLPDIPLTIQNQIGFLILGVFIIWHFLFTSFLAYKHFKIQNKFTLV